MWRVSRKKIQYWNIFFTLNTNYVLWLQIGWIKQAIIFHYIYFAGHEPILSYWKQLLTFFIVVKWKYTEIRKVTFWPQIFSPLEIFDSTIYLVLLPSQFSNLRQKANSVSQDFGPVIIMGLSKWFPHYRFISIHIEGNLTWCAFCWGIIGIVLMCLFPNLYWASLASIMYIGELCLVLFYVEDSNYKQPYL